MRLIVCSAPGTRVRELKVRLDKWLWAARFFKTRRQAIVAIDGGKVHCQGQRAKAGKGIAVGEMLTIRLGFEDKIVKVTALIKWGRSKN